MVVAARKPALRGFLESALVAVVVSLLVSTHTVQAEAWLVPAVVQAVPGNTDACC